jgi:hypothetical protein
MYIIENSVPIPSNKKCKYPFSSMEIGQSIFVEDAKMKGNLHQASKMHGKSLGKKFIARSIDNGLRIWRIA